MTDLPSWVIPMIVGAVGGSIVVFAALRVRNSVPAEPRERTPRAKRSTKKKAKAGAPLEIACSVCQRELVVARDQLRLLEPMEVGLAVRIEPELAGRKLAEYICPHCEADHCFAIDRGQPEWVGVNLYSPQTQGATCQECRKALRRPPWPKGQYDGRPQEATAMDDDFGMVCGRCEAVCCVACVTKATRNRTEDGAFLCPRCHRSPVETFFHP